MRIYLHVKLMVIVVFLILLKGKFSKLYVDAFLRLMIALHI
jgi:hypothetical protein